MLVYIILSVLLQTLEAKVPSRCRPANLTLVDSTTLLVKIYTWIAIQLSRLFLSNTMRQIISNAKRILIMLIPRKDCQNKLISVAITCACDYLCTPGLVKAVLQN